MSNFATRPIFVSFDKEDMYDIRMADQAHKEWVAGGRKTMKK